MSQPFASGASSYSIMLPPKNRIRALLRQRGMTLADLAERLGRDTATVSRWSTGRAPINQAQMQQIAEALGLPDEALILVPPERLANDDSEEAMLAAWRDADPDARAAMLALLRRK